MSWMIALSIGAIVSCSIIAIAAWATQKTPRWSWASSTVLITGGSTGIGLELAKCLAEQHVAFIVLAARRESVLQEAVTAVEKVVERCHGRTRVSYVVMDVASTASVQAAVKLAKEQCDGRAINLLICNAGFAHPTRFLDTDMAVAAQLMEVNYFGALRLLWELMPSMVAEHRGRVVLTSSMAARAPIAGYSVYAASKAGLRALAHSVDMEYSCLGVRCQVVSPPDVETPGYAEENTVKSPECRAISSFGGAAPFTSAAMAAAVVRGIERYSFDITLGSDGLLLNYGSAAMEPATDVVALLTQFVVGGWLRLGLAVFSKFHYDIVRRVRMAEKPKEGVRAGRA